MITEEFKSKAYKLRKLGKSYNYISKELNIPKSTLSYWFKYISWSREIREKNKEGIKEESTRRIILVNEIKKNQSVKKHKQMEKEAVEEFERYKNNPVFIASLMLYLGEGDKSTNTGHIRICNVNPSVLKIFIRFLTMFCGISFEKIRFWLLCYPDHDRKKCLDWWSKETGFRENQFYKTQVIQGKHKEKKLPYGVGNITITSVLLKTKVLKWIEIMSNYLTRV